ncbi:MAG TPA: hypothetical protein VMP86_00570 [Candidatus Binatia bacterium]|nr:hypothetical protein [Candidatus Binatia bacterium]
MRRVALITLLFVLAACSQLEAPSPSATATPTPSTAPTPSATATATTDGSASAIPSASVTPEPPLSLDLPEATDPRVVSVSVRPNVGAEAGDVIVSVTSAADERIDELVLRWPTDLNETLFLAPFVPSPDRLAAGQPLLQDWTKWVIGPGEQGEPDGTISLGYGPLLAGATLEIRLHAQRRAPGPVSFDLQVLSSNDLLTLAGGEPAELRVEVP